MSCKVDSHERDSITHDGRHWNKASLGGARLFLPWKTVWLHETKVKVVCSYEILLLYRCIKM